MEVVAKHAAAHTMGLDVRCTVAVFVLALPTIF